MMKSKINLELNKSMQIENGVSDNMGIYEEEFFLTAGHCNAQGVMPVTMILSRLIEVATAHANNLNIGYENLKKFGLAWVLSRVSISVERYPVINERYIVQTWIESYGRHFSERNFLFKTPTGENLAWVKSIWAPLDMQKRCLGDLTDLKIEPPIVDIIKCPITKAEKVVDVGEDQPAVLYPFHYTDIDFNRHVNSVRYLELIMNQWDMRHHDKKMIVKLDVNYINECHYGQIAEIRTLTQGDETITSLSREGIRALGIKIKWQDR